MSSEPQRDPYAALLTDLTPPDSDPFDQLDSEFQTTYGRPLRFTGRDTATHIRLHGKNQARDIGVKELSGDELKFVLKRGPELGLDLKDYSKAKPHTTSTGVKITGPHVHANRAKAKALAPAEDPYAAILGEPEAAQDDPYAAILTELGQGSDSSPVGASQAPASPAIALSPSGLPAATQASRSPLKTPNLTTGDVQAQASRTIEQMLAEPDFQERIAASQTPEAQQEVARYHAETQARTKKPKFAFSAEMEDAFAESRSRGDKDEMAAIGQHAGKRGYEVGADADGWTYIKRPADFERRAGLTSVVGERAGALPGAPQYPSDPAANDLRRQQRTGTKWLALQKLEEAIDNRTPAQRIAQEAPIRRKEAKRILEEATALPEDPTKLPTVTLTPQSATDRAYANEMARRAHRSWLGRTYENIADLAMGTTETGQRQGFLESQQRGTEEIAGPLLGLAGDIGNLGAIPIEAAGRAMGSDTLARSGDLARGMQELSDFERERNKGIVPEIVRGGTDIAATLPAVMATKVPALAMGALSTGRSLGRGSSLPEAVGEGIIAAGPLFVLQGSPLGGYAREIVSKAFAPEAKILATESSAASRLGRYQKLRALANDASTTDAERAVAATRARAVGETLKGESQVEIDKAVGALRQRLIADVAGITAQGATNIAQFVGTSAALELGINHRKMTSEEIIKQGLMVLAFESVPTLRAASEVKRRVQGFRGAEEARRAIQLEPGQAPPIEAGRQIGTGEPLVSKPTEEVPLGTKAVWQAPEGDTPVTVTGDLGVKNGRRYVEVAESKTGIPVDELMGAPKEVTSGIDQRGQATARVEKGKTVGAAQPSVGVEGVASREALAKEKVAPAEETKKEEPPSAEETETPTKADVLAETPPALSKVEALKQRVRDERVAQAQTLRELGYEPSEVTPKQARRIIADEEKRFAAAEVEAEEMAVEARAETGKAAVKEGVVVSEEPARVPGVEGIVKRAKESERRAQDVAGKDKLTGLRNQGEWKGAQPRIDVDSNLHIVRLDVNELKATNDLYSHEAGDRYIQQVGQIIKEEATKAGISERSQWRTGGDEFTLSGSKESAQKAAIAIRARIAKEVNLPSGKKGSVAVGVGPTEKRADAMMYVDKRSRKAQANVQAQEIGAPAREGKTEARGKAQPEAGAVAGKVQGETKAVVKTIVAAYEKQGALKASDEAVQAARNQYKGVRLNWESASTEAATKLRVLRTNIEETVDRQESKRAEALAEQKKSGPTAKAARLLNSANSLRQEVDRLLSDYREADAFNQIAQEKAQQQTQRKAAKPAAPASAADAFSQALSARLNEKRQSKAEQLKQRIREDRGAPKLYQEETKSPWKIDREYKGSDGGRYVDYVFGDKRNGMLTVEIDQKRGYRVRNVFVDTPLQRQGNARSAYDMLNAQSLAETGKPLRSSEIGYDRKTGATSMSQDAQKVWDDLVAKGKATKLADHYEYISSLESNTLFQQEGPRTYDEINLPEDIKRPLLEIAQSFLAEGQTDYSKLVSNFETLLGGDLEYVVDSLGAIVAHAENLERLRTAPSDKIDLAPGEATEKAVATGKTSRAVTPRGIEVKTRFALFESDQPITSHDIELRPNPHFPEGVQNRDRAKVSSEDDLNEKIKRFEPEYLGRSIEAGRGAPILGPDMAVESGNGRVIMLRRIYRDHPVDARKYKSWLEENAARFGMTRAQVEAMNQPILAQVRLTELSPAERIQFAEQANEDTQLKLSPVEVARGDARKMSAGLIAQFKPGADGDMLAAGNRDFVKGFLDQVVGPSRGDLLTSSGELNQAGVQRINNAIFARAYADTEAGVQALEKLAEETDVNTKRVITAMVAVAPRFVELKQMITAGGRYALDLSPDLAEAARQLSLVRESGVTVDEFLRQGQLFGENLSRVQKKLLWTLNEHARSSAKLSQVLTNYLDTVDSYGDPRQQSFFTENVPTKEETLEAAVRRLSDADQSNIGSDTQKAIGGAREGLFAERPAPVAGEEAAPAGSRKSVAAPKKEAAQPAKPVVPTDRSSFKKALISEWGTDPEVAHRTAEIAEAIAQQYVLDLKATDPKTDTVKAKREFFGSIRIAPAGEAGARVLEQNTAVASTEFTQTGEAILRAGRNANESSAIHELFHASLPLLARLASQPNAPAGLKAAIDVIVKHSGFASVTEYLKLHEGFVHGDSLKSLQIKAARFRAQMSRNEGDQAQIERDLLLAEKEISERRHYESGSEKGARAWEGFFREGKSPTKALQAALTKFGEWLSRIYQRIRPDMEMSDNVRRAFDRILGGEREQAALNVKENDHWNFSKSTFASPETEARFRDVIRTAVAQGGDAHKTKVTFQEHLARVEALSPDLVPEVKRLRDIQIVSREIFTKAAQYAQTLTAQAQDLRSQITPATMPDEALALEDRITVLEHDAAEIAEGLTGARSEFGRNLSFMAVQKNDQMSPENVLAIGKAKAEARGLDKNSRTWRTAAQKLFGSANEVQSAEKEKKRLRERKKGVEDGTIRPPKEKAKREPWQSVMLSGLKAQAKEASARLQQIYGAKLYQEGSLTFDELDQVRAKFESLKKSAAGRPIKTVVDDYIRQLGLFGSEMSPAQQGALMELASPTRRAPLSVEQSSLFETSPTLESRREQSQIDKAGPSNLLFQKEGGALPRVAGRDLTRDAFDLAKDDDYVTVYHGIERAALPDILREGITPMRERDRSGHPYVFVSAKIAHVEGYGDGPILAVRVRKGDLAVDPIDLTLSDEREGLEPAVEDSLFSEFSGSSATVSRIDRQDIIGIVDRSLPETEPADDPNILFQESNIPAIAHDIATILAARVAEESQTKKGLPLDRILEGMRGAFPDVIGQYEEQIKATADSLLKDARRQALVSAARDPETQVSARRQLALDVADSKRLERQTQEAADQKRRQVDRIWEREAAKAEKEAAAAWDRSNAEWYKVQEETVAQGMLAEVQAERAFKQQEARARAEQQIAGEKLSAEEATKRLAEIDAAQAREREQINEELKAEAAAQKQFEKDQRAAVLEEAKRVSRAALEADHAKLQDVADEAREQMKANREAAREAVKSGVGADARARRKAEREQATREGRWDYPITVAASEARERIAQTGYTPTVEDIAAIAAGMRIEEGRIASPYQELVSEFGEFYRKNAVGIRNRAAAMLTDARSGALQKRIETKAAGRAEGKTKPREQAQAREDYLNWQAEELSRLTAEEAWQDKRIRNGKRDIAREFAKLNVVPWWEKATDVWGLFRSQMASIDLLHLRQGSIMLLNHPTVWVKSLWKTVHTWTEAQMDERTNELENHPLAELARMSGLRQAAVEQRRSPLSILARQEEFQNRLVRAKAKLFGKSFSIFPHLVVSERQYTTGGDTLRMGLFALHAEPLLEKYPPSLHPEVYSTIAHISDIVTGIGDPGRFAKEVAFLTRYVGFAPNWLLSRFQLLGMLRAPFGYRGQPIEVRRIAAREAYGYAIRMSALFALAHLLGITSFDIDDDDFLKLNIPLTNQKWDITAGGGGYIKTLLKLLRSSYRKATGQPEFVGDSFGDTVKNFARSKLAPVPSFLWDKYEGTTFTGEPFTWTEAIANRTLPMIVGDQYDNMRVDGARGLIALPFQVLGGNVSSYRSRKMPDRTGSETERQATGLLRERDFGKETFEEANRRQLLAELVAARKAGKPTERILAELEKGTPLQRLIPSVAGKPGGPLTDKEKENIEERMTVAPLERAYKYLDEAQKLQVRDVATPAELAKIEPTAEVMKARLKLLFQSDEYKTAPTAERAEMMKRVAQVTREGKNEAETSLNIQRDTVHDRLVEQIKSAPEFKALSKDDKERFLSRFGQGFSRAYRVDKDVPEGSRTKEAEKKTKLLELFSKPGADGKSRLEKEIEEALGKVAGKKAA